MEGEWRCIVFSLSDTSFFLLLDSSLSRGTSTEILATPPPVSSFLIALVFVCCCCFFLAKPFSFHLVFSFHFHRRRNRSFFFLSSISPRSPSGCSERPFGMSPKRGSTKSIARDIRSFFCLATRRSEGLESDKEIFITSAQISIF